MMDRPEIERRYLDTRDGMRLHVASSGDGPPLLLLHGFTGSSETWTPFRAPFGAAHRVIALDLPGHGRSSAPAEPESYALDRFARDLALVLDELGVDRVALLGYSMQQTTTRSRDRPLPGAASRKEHLCLLEQQDGCIL